MGIRFKLANLIMKDYLRSDLVIGVLVPLENLLKYNHNLDDWEIKQIKEVIETVQEIFKT